MAFGLIDTSYIDWPSNVDTAYLRGLQLRSGLSFAQLAAALDAELGNLNGGTDPLVASLITPTTTEFARTDGGGVFDVSKRSQYTLPRPQQVERLAHMLPIDDWEVGLGFTEDGLEEISQDDFAAQVRAMRRGWERRHRRETLQRLFSDDEVPVGVGTAATSPGFAGSGTGGNVFGGTFPDGSALPGGYTHYLRDTAANVGVVTLAARNLLQKWYGPPYDLIAPATQVDLIVALGTAGGFVPSGSVLVRPGDGTAQALVDPGEFVGVLHGDIRVRRAITDFTTANIAVYKSFGAFNPMNPLAWRWDTLKGRDVTVRSRNLFPLAEAVSMQRFGVGVNNRTAAVLILLAASGGYVDATIA